MSTTTLSHKCTQTALGWFKCQSLTQANKSYEVFLHEDGIRNTCSCIAFAMKRNKIVKFHREHGYPEYDQDSALMDPDCSCKHIKALKATRSGCGWTSDSKEQHEYKAICPRCFSKTEEYDTRDPATVDLDELMKDFLALKEKLKKAKA